MELTLWKQTKQLGTKLADVYRLDDHFKKEKEVAIMYIEQMREDLELERHVGMKKCSLLDQRFVNAKIEQLWDFTEPDCIEKFIWCKGVVVALKIGI